MFYRNYNTYFWYSRSVQKDLPVTAMWHLKGNINDEFDDILSVSEISSDSEDDQNNDNVDQKEDDRQSDTTRNVRPRYKMSNTTSSTTPSQTNVQTYTMCENQFAM